MINLSSVHIEISNQVKATVATIEDYQKMDLERERLIELIITDYKNGKSINLEKLNSWTNTMNQFAIKNHLPTRKLVTIEMVENFLQENC